MKIQVTANNIRQGAHSSAYCPIALAIKEVVGRDKRVLVGRGSVSVAGSDYRLPEAARTFIDHYDGGMVGVSPFEFELDDNQT